MPVNKSKRAGSPTAVDKASSLWLAFLGGGGQGRIGLMFYRGSYAGARVAQPWPNYPVPCVITGFQTPDAGFFSPGD